MTTLIVVLIIVSLLILVWILFNKKNNHQSGRKLQMDLNLSYILDENAKEYKQNPSIYQMRGLEFIDMSGLFDSCGKDITYSTRLLRDLYGSELNDKIVMYNKDDEILYNNRWTSVNVCRTPLTEADIVKYGKREGKYVGA
jgi:hypothetical protein